MSQELKITKERVLKAAEKCSTAKDTLKELFPEAFDSRAFKFGSEYLITEECEGPLFIGNGFAPDGLENRCLLVWGQYDMEVTESDGFKCLVFRKKP